MAESPARAVTLSRLIGVAERDPRIVGLVYYGGSSADRVDLWSDIDVAVFLRDDAYEAFAPPPAPWAAQLGQLLLMFGGLGQSHAWLRTVYEASPVPLRMDFVFYREAQAETALRWPDVPTARSATVWHDATGGRLAACMRELANQCLAPPDPARAFEDTCGTFWYYLLYTNGKLERGDGLWGPLQAFHLTVLPSLFRLLRLEAGALDEWFGAPAAKDLDGILTPERRSQLEGCAPGQGPAGQRQALRAAARLGRDVCAELARRHGWAWPETLAERAVRLLSANNAAGAPG